MGQGLTRLPAAGYSRAIRIVWFGSPDQWKATVSRFRRPRPTEAGWGTYLRADRAKLV